MMINEPNIGPYGNNESYKKIVKISEECHRIYHSCFTREFIKNLTPGDHYFLRFLYAAETTSFSIRLLTSWVLTLQALALTRIRLEQTIVCSYLIHENFELGFKAFIEHMPIKNEMLTKAAMKYPEIADKIRGLQNKASREPSEPGSSDCEGIHYQRNWTKLDLFTMARKRDEMAKGENVISNDRLELAYVSVYKDLSSIVHSDANSLSDDYINYFFQKSKNRVVTMVNPSWNFIGLAGTAIWDILQVFEILNFYGFNKLDDFISLDKELKMTLKEFN